MAKLDLPQGATSVTVNVFLQDSSSTTGAGLTGLVYNTSSLTCYSIRPRVAPAAVTLATLAAVTSAYSSGGFKELDATNAPGWYRFDIPDATIANAERFANFHFKGAANLAPLPVEVQLVAYNNQDGVRIGLTALPNAAAEASGGLATLSAAQGSGGAVPANIRQFLGTAITETAGQIAAAFTKFFNKASPTGTVNSLPDAVPDASGGLPVTGNRLTAIPTVALVTLVTTTTTLTNAPSDSAGTGTLLSRLSATRAGYLDNLSAGAVATASKLLKYMQLLLRKDSAIATDNSTEVTEINANGGSGAGAYANTTDALEANRDNMGILTSGERTTLANVIEAEIIDDTDSEKVLEAITNKIASVNPSLGSLTLAAIAAAVRDVSNASPAANSLGAGVKAVSDRVPGSGTLAIATDVPSASSNASAVRTNLATELARIDIAISAADDATLTAIASALSTLSGAISALNNLSSAQAQTAATAALNAYDPPTRAEATTDKDAVIAAIPSVPTTAQVADKVLGRNLAGGSDGGRTVTSALRKLRNKVAIVSGTMTVYAEDDTTADHTEAVTTAAGDPISATDPVG